MHWRIQGRIIGIGKGVRLRRNQNKRTRDTRLKCLADTRRQEALGILFGREPRSDNTIDDATLPADDRKRRRGKKNNQQHANQYPQSG